MIARRALLMTLLAASGAVSAADADALCDPSERVIWSCSAGPRRLAVCASGELSSTTGYLQYRAGEGAGLDVTYPSKPVHPKGLFVLSLLPRGASLAFRNGDDHYAIHEPLIGSSTIDVVRAGRAVATITCAIATDGLTLTSTQEQLSRVGVYRAPGTR